MRILYFSPHPHLHQHAPTGYGTHIREMIASWRRMDITVQTFIAGDKPAEAAGEARPSGLKSTARKLLPRILWESIKDLKLIRFDTALEKELEAIVQNFRPDLIYERVAYLQNSGVRVAAKHGIRHIAEINAPFPEERVSFSGKSLFVKMSRDNLREILIKSDCISVVSSALRDHLLTQLTDAEGKIHVVPNSVNPASVNHNPPRVREIREELGLEGFTVIGFVGSIFPYHGVDTLIDAFAELENPEVKLLIVGDGETLPELKARARAKGVLGRTIFTGSVPHRDVFPLIEAMDICCMARSNWYGSPVKIFEYGLMKKPVIAPDVIPVRDVMGPEDGILVKPDVGAFRSALERLVKDPALRNQLAENWQQKVLLNHTWDISAQKTLTLCT